MLKLYLQFQHFFAGKISNIAKNENTNLCKITDVIKYIDIFIKKC